MSSIIGNRVLRREDRSFLTTGATYTADVDDPRLAGAVHATYASSTMAELPSFELVPLETPTPNNPLGVKGIGESGAIGSTPAVQSAVLDAIAHLGVTHLDVPLTPRKVWAAIHGA